MLGVRASAWSRPWAAAAPPQKNNMERLSFARCGSTVNLCQTSCETPSLAQLRRGERAASVCGSLLLNPPLHLPVTPGLVVALFLGAQCPDGIRLARPAQGKPEMISSSSGGWLDQQRFWRRVGSEERLNQNLKALCVTTGRQVPPDAAKMGGGTATPGQLQGCTALAQRRRERRTLAEGNLRDLGDLWEPHEEVIRTSVGAHHVIVPEEERDSCWHCFAPERLSGNEFHNEDPYLPAVFHGLFVAEAQLLQWLEQKHFLPGNPSSIKSLPASPTPHGNMAA